MLASTAAAEGLGLWPWASQNADPPPPVPPFEIPTFSGQRKDFRALPPEWVKAPRIDGEAVYRTIVACYPARSLWRVDVDLEAALRSARMTDITGTPIGRSYAGIVMRMPLYSATELDREREREYRRRLDTARLVAAFIEHIAARNKALRQLALFATMEERARVRVSVGVADADEQVRYLDKVAAAEEDLIQAEANILEARLALVGMCRDEEADRVSAYLANLARLPEEAKP